MCALTRKESVTDQKAEARPKAWLAWSSGKDSAWALHVTRRRRDFDVVALLTTVNRTHNRGAMPAVRASLLEAQAASSQLPLVVVPIPSPCSNQEYEVAMAAAMDQARSQGVTQIIFGDLFLDDVRRYREEKLAACGMKPAFPLWGIPTRQLAEEMIASGLKSFITCVDPRKLDKSFAGREWDAGLFSDLPPSVDCCGKNGEFHTFAFAGPMFREPIGVRRGEIVEREGFVFADLLG